jgi:hypothetical protein
MLSQFYVLFLACIWSTLLMVSFSPLLICLFVWAHLFSNKTDHPISGACFSLHRACMAFQRISKEKQVSGTTLSAPRVRCVKPQTSCLVVCYLAANKNVRCNCFSASVFLKRCVIDPFFILFFFEFCLFWAGQVLNTGWGVRTKARAGRIGPG